MARRKPNPAKMPWQGQLFTFLQGPEAELFIAGDPFLRSQLDKTLWHNKETETYVGSNHGIVTRADTRARDLTNGAMRVVTLQDTEHPTLKEMIRGKYWTDVPEAIIQTQEDDFANQIAEIAKEREFPFELPCKVTGLDVKLQDGKNIYAPRDDFALAHDESLNYKNNRKQFNRMENGFPIIEDNGEHTWFLRNNRSARVCRNSIENAVGDFADFGYSNSYARVVLTVDAVDAPKICEGFVKNLLDEFKTLSNDLQQKYERAATILKE